MTARPQGVALLPCPFCGSACELVNMSDSLFVACAGSECMGLLGGFDSAEEAASRWNTRANVTAALASAQAREKELRAEVEFHKLDAGALRSQMDVLRDGLEVQRRNAQTALNWYEEERVIAERLEEALRKIATVAHAGGSVGMSESDALTAIRKLTLKHWDRNAEPKHVRAALSTNPATKTGERT